MGLLSIRVPDIGEGVAEAELVEWHVAVGQQVRPDDILAAVMTDKATVEIPSSAAGKVVRLGAAVGETVAIGSELVRLEVEGEGAALESERMPPEEQHPPAPESETGKVEPAARPAARDGERTERPVRKSDSPEKPLASPAVRRRALEAGIDLRLVRSSGPAGRVTHEDLDAFAAGAQPAPHAPGKARRTEVTDIKIAGLRRRIAERMALASRDIPHITIVEEVDVTALETLRAALNGQRREGRPKLTPLPFIMRAIVDVVGRQPALNAHFDGEAGILRQFAGVHVGIATQTPAGLLVPVLRHAEALDLWAAAEGVARLSQAARNSSAAREELTGSTITITSLGALGALATTPIINHPEVAIVGVNRMAVRPHWDGARFVPRSMMNLSCSFDHRVVDGWDAAVFVQRLRTLLETPALLFVDG